LTSFRQKKKYGQVFLKDSAPMYPLLDKISEASPKLIIEIGPGKGVLSRLLKKIAPIQMIEIDPDVVSFIQADEELGGDKILHEDFLKADLQTLVGEFAGETIVTGNIPYNISTQILLKVFKNLHLFSGCGFMVQKEFAKRLVAPVDTKAYGRLSVITQLHGDVQKVCDVSRLQFKPVPKVDSQVFWMDPFESFPSENFLKNLKEITHNAFSKRRKTIRNSLAPYRDGLEELGWDLQKRAENITVEQYRTLCEWVEKQRQEL